MNLDTIIKSLFLLMVLINLMACQNESTSAPSKPTLTSQEHDQLLLRTKQAILDLDVSLVTSLAGKIDINRPLPDQSTLLSWAVETQEPDLVNVLLEQGAKANVTNGNRFSPMIQACRYGNNEIINALLERGADPNSSIDDGTTAFQLCAGSTSVESLSKMVNSGAELQGVNRYGQNALMFAANSGNVENLQFLITTGAIVNQQTQQGYSPLFFAIKSQNLAAVKTLINEGADLFATAQDGTTASQLAVYTNNIEFLTWYANSLDTLMTADAATKVLTAFDRNGDQLLHAAVKANQPQLVIALLQAGANPTTISEPSTLTWRYEANFKTENYIPPQLTPIEIAQKHDFKEVLAILKKEQTLAGI